MHTENAVIIVKEKKRNVEVLFTDLVRMKAQTSAFLFLFLFPTQA